MVESNHIKIGWNKKTGRFEYEIGDGVRLSDLAMFSLYLQEMALENDNEDMGTVKIGNCPMKIIGERRFIEKRKVD